MMKVFFHNDFYSVYTTDPAAAAGRMEAVINVIEPVVELHSIVPATFDEIAAIHTERHIEHVKQKNLYDISALAAGGAIQAAEAGRSEPCFALIRPPGHHASADSSWGFCYFNNMAIAIAGLKAKAKIQTAYILDIDLHYGDGNVNILGNESYVILYNVEACSREDYMEQVEKEMTHCTADMIGISAGFDYHINDWGSLLITEDYFQIGKIVSETAKRNNGGCFAVLEGGYNHEVLGWNVKALIEGLWEGWAG